MKTLKAPFLLFCAVSLSGTAAFAALSDGGGRKDLAMFKSERVLEQNQKKIAELQAKQRQAALELERQGLEELRATGDWLAYYRASLAYLQKLSLEQYLQWQQGFVANAERLTSELAALPTEQDFHPHRVAANNGGNVEIHRQKIQNELEHEILGFLEYAFTQGALYKQQDQKMWRNGKTALFGGGIFTVVGTAFTAGVLPFSVWMGGVACFFGPLYKSLWHQTKRDGVENGLGADFLRTEFVQSEFKQETRLRNLLHVLSEQKSLPENLRAKAAAIEEILQGECNALLKKSRPLLPWRRQKALPPGR